MDLAAIAALIIHYRYWILFPLACFEGPLVAIVIGFLVSLGYFDFFAAYVVMLFGDIVPDTLYYYLGRYGKRTALIKRYGHKIGINDDRAEKVRTLWNTHGLKTMWMGKLAYGLSIPFLVSAGFIGMPLRRFLLYAIPVTMFQYGVLMALGYYFGNSYGVIASSFTDIQFLLAGLALAGACYYGFTLFMQKRLLRQGEIQE